MTTPTAIGAALREHVHRNKINITDLCETAEIGRQTWYDLTDGKHPPTNDTQRGIARAFGWTVDWYDRMLEGEEPTGLADVLTSLLRQPSGEELLARVDQLGDQDVELMRLVGELRADVDRLRSEVDRLRGDRGSPEGSSQAGG